MYRYFIFWSFAKMQIEANFPNEPRLLMKVLGLLVTSQSNWTLWPWVSCLGCCGREHRRKIASLFRCNFHDQEWSYTSISPSLALHAYGGVKLGRLLYSSATLRDRVSSQIFIGCHCHTAVATATAQTHASWPVVNESLPVSHNTDAIT